MSEVSINNLDEIKLYLRQELAILARRLEESIANNKPKEPSNSINVNNLGQVIEALDKLSGKIESLDMAPVVNVASPDIIMPNITVPDIHVPQSIVNVEAPNVSVSPASVIIDLERVIQALLPLQYLSTSPRMTIAVRISDGKSFVQAIQAMARGQDKMLQVFSNNTGLSKDEFLAGTRQLYRSSSATNTFATVGVSSGVVLASNGSRISATFVNDSSSTIYLAKGATAVIGSGIRLNSLGGSLIVDEFQGAINGIATSVSSNLTVCEVY